MNGFVQDVRFALRSFRKSPGVTLVALISIALGIAANTSVFTLVNGFLLRPLPVQSPDRLVALYTTDPNQMYPDAFSYPDYVDYRDNTHSFGALFVHWTTPLSLKGRDGIAEMAAGELVTGNYFTGLQLDPALGRLLTPQDDITPGAHPVVVLGYGFWQRRFGGDRNVVGQTVKLNGHDFTIIGVAREGFSGTRQLGWIPDVYVPFMMYAQVVPGADQTLLTGRGRRQFNVNGRLEDGVTIEQARLEMNNVARQLAREYPATNENIGVGILPGGRKVQPAIELLGYSKIAAAIMMGLVALVLLVACANVANLLLARATTRRKEIAVRLALGASGKRLIQQLLTESVMLSMLGGALGLMLAMWLNQLFQLAAPPLDFATVDAEHELALDYRVLAFTLALSVLTGIVFGLVPTLQTSRPDVVPALKGESGTVLRRFRWLTMRDALVVSQVALSLMLIVSAGLLIKSMRNAQTMDPGFSTDRLLMASVDVHLHDYDEVKGRNFYRQLIERIRRMPGVERASFGGPLPLDSYSSSTTIAIEGRVPKTEHERLNVALSVVGDRYFETMNTAVVKGRAFDERDNQNAPRVAIINETMARHYWPDQEVIGKRLRINGPQGELHQIVGVAKDGKYNLLGEPPTDYFFLPFWQNYDGRMTLLVRTASAPETMSAGIRREVRELDDQLPVYGMRTAPQYLDRLLSAPKSIAALVGLFGLLALSLAAVGLYGVMSYSVAQRMREIGIRVVLGARPSDAIGMVLRQAFRLSGIAAIVGFAGALALPRLLASLLYGVTSNDPWVLGLTCLTLMVVALFASLVPARRATKADPMVALRAE